MRIAYLTTCFGTQSHTFIRREIRALRALGLDLMLYGIRRDADRTAPDAADLVAETHYLYPLDGGAIVAGNLKAMARSPRRYVGGLLSAFFAKEYGLKRRMKMVYHYLVSVKSAEMMKSSGITHVHAHFMNVSASVAMYAAYHAQLPFSVTVHSAGTFRTPAILGTHQKLRQAQLLMMISEYNIDYFDKIERCRDKSHVVRCGMELRGFEFHPGYTYIPSSPAKLLAVGRFVEKKGFRYLIEAAAHLRDRGVEFALEIIGDGPLRASLQRQVTALGIDSHVRFSGQQGTEYVRQAMSDSDLVIVPSVTSESGEMEGLPVVIMEAMACGTPVVASAHSGIPEIVQDGTTGLLTPEKDAAAIADAVAGFLAQPRPEFIDNARALIEKTFNIESIAQRRCELFKRYHRER